MISQLLNEVYLSGDLLEKTQMRKGSDKKVLIKDLMDSYIGKEINAPLDEKENIEQFIYHNSKLIETTIVEEIYNKKGTISFITLSFEQKLKWVGLKTYLTSLDLETLFKAYEKVKIK